MTSIWISITNFYESTFIEPGRDGLVVNMSVSHAEGRGFAPRTGHNKDHHKVARVVCGTAYEDIHYTYLLGSIERVYIMYCLPVSDFYLLLHSSVHSNGVINQKVKKNTSIYTRVNTIICGIVY